MGRRRFELDPSEIELEETGTDVERSLRARCEAQQRELARLYCELAVLEKALEDGGVDLDALPREAA